MSFCHLHVHTEYSLLDGACRISRLFEHLKELGQNSCAVTDHGVMYGAVEFYKAAKKAGIKPIIGCELYVAPRTRFDKSSELDSGAYHLVALVKNEQGYKNLIKLCSKGFTEGFYQHPRVDFELLSQYHEGIIFLSACLAGEVQQLLLSGDYDGAKALALKYFALFGEGNYYLELQDHGIDEQQRINPQLVRLSHETGIPLVATNDAHYISREDAKMHDVLLCIQTGSTVSDEKRMRFATDEFYLKSEDEMAALFPYAPEAIQNTQKIADECNFDFTFGKYHLPNYQTPGNCDHFEYLTKLCAEGFARRYPEKPEEIKNKLEYELSMINKMGFTDYFLIVQDFVNYAKSNGIPVGPGRGSAAGSIAAYCLNITNVEPTRYSLFFERFLNPERVSMPDIDMDFCPLRRQEVIKYVTEKYGDTQVCQIITFGTMAARGSLRDVGRVLGVPYAEVDKIAKAVPQELKITLDKALETAPDFKAIYDSDEQAREIIDTARKIEGMPRNCSTHAAGVIIAASPVDDYVPLSRSDQGTVTQFDMVTVEELGLLKMDFLGLRNLTVIDDTVKMLAKRGINIGWDNLNYEDAETFALLANGQTTGVFQMESPGMTRVAVQLKPRSVEDITAIIALYRPGPMASIPTYIENSRHPENVKYIHPRLREILSITYGCIVYQEQVMEIFRRLAGYSLARADLVRRAMSKKKMDVLKAERQNFVFGNEAENIYGCISIGMSEKDANALFDEMLDFANYAFNKAHAVCYAVVAYMTAYLKCHYPSEYMAALLTSVLGDNEKVALYTAQCRDLGISILPPDINRSGVYFSVENGDIRFGLGSVKNVGVGLIDRLVTEREKNGLFADFDDFCTRMSAYDLNRRALEGLIACGAFDFSGAYRSQLTEVCASVLETVSSEKRSNIAGQLNIFDVAPIESEKTHLPDIPEYPKTVLLSLEKEATGLYLSGHPAQTVSHLTKRLDAVSISALLSSLEDDSSDEYHDGDYLTIAGVVGNLKSRYTKSGKMMANATVEDETGALDVIVFDNALQNGGREVTENSVAVCFGRLSLREDEPPKLVCDLFRVLDDEQIYAFPPERAKIQSLNMYREYKNRPGSAYPPKFRTVYLRFSSQNDPKKQQALALLQALPGESDVCFFYEDTRKTEIPPLRVSDCAELAKRLDTLFAPEDAVIKFRKAKK